MAENHSEENKMVEDERLRAKRLCETCISQEYQRIFRDLEQKFFYNTNLYTS